MPETDTETLADWRPSEIGRRLLAGRVRWGLLTVVALLVTILATLGIWLWQRPAAIASAARSDVMRQADILSLELVQLQDLNAGVTKADIDASAISSQSLAVDAGARDLFDAAGALPRSTATTRSQATAAAGMALDASRLLSDSVAYRSAVVPLLIAPELETDPDLIALDEAIRQFGAWRAHFDEVRSALPTDTLTAVSSRLETISGSFDEIQAGYVDGLSADDGLAALRALQELRDRLSDAVETLDASLIEVQGRVDELIVSTLAVLNRMAS